MALAAHHMSDNKSWCECSVMDACVYIGVYKYIRYKHIAHIHIYVYVYAYVYIRIHMDKFECATRRLTANSCTATMVYNDWIVSLIYSLLI